MRKIWRAITSVPMRDEGFAFTDVVSGKSVRRYVDRHGERWLCTNRWGIGRVDRPTPARLALILGGDCHGEVVVLKEGLADGDRYLRQHANRPAQAYQLRRISLPFAVVWLYGWVLLHEGHQTKTPEVWFRTAVRSHLMKHGTLGGES